MRCISCSCVSDVDLFVHHRRSVFRPEDDKDDDDDASLSAAALW